MTVDSERRGISWVDLLDVDLLGYDEALEALSDQMLCGSAVIAIHSDGTVKRVPPSEWFDKVFADGAQSRAEHEPRRSPMQEQIDRVEAWAKTLIDGQAPHQQALAQDAMMLVNHAKQMIGPSDMERAIGPADPFDVADAVATVPKDAYDKLEAGYGELRAQMDKLSARSMELQHNAQVADDKSTDLQRQLDIAKEQISTLVDEKGKLEEELGDLTSQLEAATAPKEGTSPIPFREGTQTDGGGEQHSNGEQS